MIEGIFFLDLPLFIISIHIHYHWSIGPFRSFPLFNNKNTIQMCVCVFAYFTRKKNLTVLSEYICFIITQRLIAFIQCLIFIIVIIIATKNDSQLDTTTNTITSKSLPN